MRFRAWLVVLVMLAGTVGIAWHAAPRAAACSCVAATPTEQAQWADLVAVGTVTATSVPEGAVVYGDEGITFTVELSSIWKGEARRTIEVQTPGSSASCGLDMLAPGMQIILFTGHTDLYGEPIDGWSSNLCGGTGPFEQTVSDELSAALGEQRAPLPDPVGPTPTPSSAGVPGGMLLPLAVALGVALVAGWVGSRRYSRTPTAG